MLGVASELIFASLVFESLVNKTPPPRHAASKCHPYFTKVYIPQLSQALFTLLFCGRRLKSKVGRLLSDEVKTGTRVCDFKAKYANRYTKEEKSI